MSSSIPTAPISPVNLSNINIEVGEVDFQFSPQSTNSEFTRPQIAALAIGECSMARISSMLTRSLTFTGCALCVIIVVGFAMITRHMHMLATSSHAQTGDSEASNEMSMRESAFDVGRPRNYLGCTMNTATLLAASLTGSLLGLDMNPPTINLNPVEDTLPAPATAYSRRAT